MDKPWGTERNLKKINNEVDNIFISHDVFGYQTMKIHDGTII